MTIKTYLAHLEKTKQDLLALNLPEDTELVKSPEKGYLFAFGEVSFKFTPQEAYLKNKTYRTCESLGDEQLTKVNVVVAKGVSYVR